MIGRFLVCLLVLGWGSVVAKPYLNQHALSRNSIATSINDQYDSKEFASDSEIYQKANEILNRRGYRIIVVQIAQDKHSKTHSTKNFYLYVTAERGGHRYVVKLHYPSFKVISEKRL